ncbi:MAG: PAS domain S-box protein [Gammaproteobacteria bacterium]|nr:PAS domain S-box protein [Gammaproteobacteria bacterium]
MTEDNLTLPRGETLATGTTQEEALRERVREMHCLLDVSHLLSDARHDNLDAALEAVVARLPEAWLHRPHASARLEIGDRHWQSGTGIGHRFQLAELPNGTLKVGYAEGLSLADPVFLDEEQHLLAAVAQRIGEALRRVELDAQLRFQATILDQVDDAVVGVGPDARIRYWNHGATRVYGWTAEEAIGRHSRMLLPPDMSIAEWRQRLETGLRGKPLPAETLLRRKDGSLFPGTVTQSAIRDDGGEISMIIGITRDLTEHKRVEERLRQAQKLEAIGQLTGGIAHDFNNLLTVVMGNVDLLAERFADDAEAAELAQQTLTAATRGAELTRRLLAFSGQQTLSPLVLDLYERICAMKESLQRIVGDAIEIDIEIAGTSSVDLWPTLADPAQVESAILNLCLNARDAMPHGGQLTLSLRNEHVAPAPADAAKAGTNPLTAGDYVVLTVADSGEGMARDVLERAFDPFFTTKAVGQGSGLGLSMVYGFATQSGGDVRLRSEPGIGTEVMLYLPRAEP